MVADLALGIKCFKPDKLHEYPDLHQHFEILTIAIYQANLLSHQTDIILPQNPIAYLKLLQ